MLTSKIAQHDFEPTFLEKEHFFVDNEGHKYVSLWEWIIFNGPLPFGGDHPSQFIERIGFNSLEIMSRQSNQS